MNGKQYAIERLEEELTYEEERLQRCGQRIKSLRDEIPIEERRTITCTARISGLKDAIHKLNGLDNLEKKNKIPDPVGLEKDNIRKRPASMTENLLRTETAMLYGRSIASYSLRELAAYIIYQSDRIKELLDVENES